MYVIELNDSEKIALSMRNDGATYNQIGETLGMSHEWARNLCMRVDKRNSFLSLEALGSFIQLFEQRHPGWKLELQLKT